MISLGSKPGDWVIQNAANSAAGRAVIQISRELGYRTVNVVRRPELIEELRAEGGDVVLLDDDKLRDAVAAATDGAPIRLALNAVGGESALRLAKIVAPEATMVTYGAMSLQPLTFPNGLLIFKNLHFTGFWVNKWYEQATRAEAPETFARIFEIAKRGLLETKIERTYSLGEFAEAVARAAQGQARRKNHLPNVDACCGSRLCAAMDSINSHAARTRSRQLRPLRPSGQLPTAASGVLKHENSPLRDFPRPCSVV